MKVFWSWQNDWEPKVNRHFVQRALTSAVQQLGDDFEEANRPELDHDTKGLAGAVEIAKEILRKIDTCAAFVADVTPIAKTSGGKALPNPNVMIELGWALKSPGEQKVILLMNTASGFSPSDLPFDIAHRRVMTYKLEPGADAGSRKAEEIRLAANLREALALNLHPEKSNPAGEPDFVGVAAAADDPSVWAGYLNGIDHQEFTRQVHVDIPKSSRAYIRVVPERWKDGRAPSVEAIGSLTPAVDAPIYRGSNGSYGACEQGFVRYWFMPAGPDSRILSSLTMYFDETGEFWSFISLSYHVGALDIPGILRMWVECLMAALSAFDRLGALPMRRVEVGITAVKQRSWVFPGTHSLPRKELKPIIRASDHWSKADSINFVASAYSQVRDLYGMGAATSENVLSITGQ